MQGWSVGKHRVEASVDGTMFRVSIDEQAPSVQVLQRVLGEWPLTVGKREVTVRRVRNLDVARTELWIAGVRVPPSELPIRHRRAPAGEACALHSAVEGAAYRTAAPRRARIECSTCRRMACKDCTAIDGVRCRACFDVAVGAMLRDDRSLRVKGVASGAALAILALLFGAATSSARLVGIGAALLGGLAVLVAFGYHAERSEARKAAASKSGSEPDAPERDP